MGRQLRIDFPGGLRHVMVGEIKWREPISGGSGSREQSQLLGGAGIGNGRDGYSEKARGDAGGGEPGGDAGETGH
jgi:hypothetical protein